MRLGKFLTDFLRKTGQLVYVLRTKINYVFIDLVSVKVSFLKNEVIFSFRFLFELCQKGKVYP